MLRYYVQTTGDAADPDKRKAIRAWNASRTNTADEHPGFEPSRANRWKNIVFAAGEGEGDFESGVAGHQSLETGREARRRSSGGTVPAPSCNFDPTGMNGTSEEFLIGRNAARLGLADQTASVITNAKEFLQPLLFANAFVEHGDCIRRMPQTFRHCPVARIRDARLRLDGGTAT